MRAQYLGLPRAAFSPGLCRNPAPGDFRARRSLRVALRPQPLYFSVSGEPFIDLSLAFESGDVLGLDSGAESLDLPFALRNPDVLEDDPRRFAHPRIMREIIVAASADFWVPGLSCETSRRTRRLTRFRKS